MSIHTLSDHGYFQMSKFQKLNLEKLMYIMYKGLVPQSCSVFCNPMYCSLPGSSVHGILQARILEWVAMPSSRGSSQLRDHTWVSHIAGIFLTIWASREAHMMCKASIKMAFTLFPINPHREYHILKRKLMHFYSL